MVRDLRFLVVDNNIKTRKLTVAQIAEIGSRDEPLEAGDAAGALAMLKDNTVDFAIVSWSLSGVDGPALVRCMRADTDLRRLHVLLVANDAKRDNAMVASAAGANDYILRPFSADALEKKVVRIVTLARMLSDRSLRQEARPSELIVHPGGMSLPVTAERHAC